MNGIVVIDELTNNIKSSIEFIIRGILTIQQRLISRGRRRRDRIDGLKRVLKHDRVGVLGRELDSQFERLFANVRRRIVRLPIELEHSEVGRHDRLLLELFGVLFRVRNEQIVKEALFVCWQEFVE